MCIEAFFLDTIARFFWLLDSPLIEEGFGDAGSPPFLTESCNKHPCYRVPENDFENMQGKVETLTKHDVPQVESNGAASFKASLPQIGVEPRGGNASLEVRVRERLIGSMLTKGHWVVNLSTQAENRHCSACDFGLKEPPDSPQKGSSGGFAF